MKRYLNLNGISWVLDGDTDRAMGVRPLAQKMMHVMKMQNVNNLDHVWYTHRMEDGTVIRVERFFGRDKAYVYCEPKIYAPKKRLIKKTVRQFVPAICIKSLDDWEGYIYYSANFQEVGNVAVCATPLWSGVQANVKESPYPQKPGEKSKDYSDKITACVDWISRGWSNFDIYDDWEEIQDTTNDTGWNIPDEFETNVGVAVHSVYSNAVPGGGCLLPYGYAGPEWGEDESFYVPDSGYCDQYDASGQCCQDSYSDKTICTYYYMCEVAGYDAFSSFLRRIKLIEYVQHAKSTVALIMGICWGEIYYDEVESIKEIYDDVLGKPQDRFYERINEYDYTIKVEDLVERASGDISFSPYFTPYKWETTTRLLQSEACESTQIDNETACDSTPYFYCNFHGGYIRDDCTKDSFHNKYFAVYPEYYYEQRQSGTRSPWTASGFGWSFGTWLDGSFGNVFDTTITPPTIVALIVNINGESIEVDRVEYDDPYMYSQEYYFEVTDSHIFDADGIPVYMYGYVLWNSADTKSEYARYGYFYGDRTKHYQSEKFYPAGIQETRYNRYTSPLHDVFGSAEKGLYGWGQCDGYIVETEIEVEV